MSSRSKALLSRQADLTQRLILDAGVELLERDAAAEISVRSVARQAEISERTVFRYFATRDDLVDALAIEVFRRLDEPPYPKDVAGLVAYPKAMFERFEATATLTLAALHSEIYHRIRTRDAGRRLVAIRAVIDAAAPGRTDRERRLATANIHFHVVASTWRYYRYYFEFSLRDTVACAQMAIVQALAGLGVAPT